MKKLLSGLCFIIICIFSIIRCDNNTAQNKDHAKLQTSLMLNIYLLNQNVYLSNLLAPKPSKLQISSITPSNDSACSSSWNGTYPITITLDGSLDGATYGEVQIDLSSSKYIFTNDAMVTPPIGDPGYILSFGSGAKPYNQIIINQSYIDIPEPTPYTIPYIGIRISGFRDITGGILNVEKTDYYLCTHYK
ncbi:MAG: hypothetical protein KA369_21300 [Spirochaetes bacterium]|nr:hypothetical protein [Spirochaetota bacterium]